MGRGFSKINDVLIIEKYCMQLNTEIVNFVMSLSTEESSFLGSIIESGNYRNGISWTADRLIDSPPSALEIFGLQFGGNDSPLTFKYVAPNIEWGSSSNNLFQNGKLVSVYPISNKIPSEFLGENGEITTETTSWAIDKVKKGEMSAREAVIIIRQRTGTILSETLYFTNTPLDITNPPDINELDHGVRNRNTNYKPFNLTYNVNLVDFEDLDIDGSPALANNIILNGLERSIAVNIVMRYRAENQIKILYDWGEEVEKGIDDGSIKIENNAPREKKYDAYGNLMPSPFIPYKLVPNPYRESRTDFGPIGPDLSARERISHPEYIKQPVLPPMTPDLDEKYSTKSAATATTIYMGYCQSGINASGNPSPTEYSQKVSDISDIINRTPLGDVNIVKDKGVLYGAKGYVYGGTLALAAILAIIAKSPTPISKTVAENMLNFTKGPLEQGLTTFKILKDIESEDIGRLIRDYVVYKVGHAVAHPHGAIQTAISNVVRRGVVLALGRSALAFIPWIGWGLAGGIIILDLVVLPAIETALDAKEKFDKYIEAITIRYETREDGTVEAWSLDPGLYLNGFEVERPVLGPGITTRTVEVTDDGLSESIQSEPPNVISTSPIIGVKRDPKTGKAIIDSNRNIIPIYDEDGTKPKMDTNPKIIAGEEISDYRISEPKIQSKINSAYIKDTISKQESISLISRSEYIPMDMGFYAPDPLPDPRQDLPPEDIDPITPPEWDISYDSSVWINNWTSGVSLDVLNNPLSPTGRTQIQSYPYNSTSPNVNANGEPQTPSFYGNETFTIPAS